MNKQAYILLSLFCLLLGTLPVDAQRNRKASRSPSASQKFMQQSPFFNEQWWVGIKGGFTTARALPVERYSVFQSLNADSEGAFDKEYMDYEFSSPATAIGLMCTYSFWKNLSVSLQPTYTNMKFGYKNHFVWEGEGAKTVQLDQSHRFAVSYLEVPLLFRYDIYRANLRPYIQAGAFYGRLLKADKSMEVRSMDAASGAVNPLENTVPAIGANELFIRTNLGWLAGGGFNYDLGSMRMGFEVFYKQGFYNVTDRQNRFSDQRMVGAGDVMDDIKLRSWEAVFSLQFPLKFLDTGSFQPAKP